MSITSCEDCPSLLSPSEARAFFDDQTIRTPRCAQRGYLLGIPEIGEQDGPGDLAAMEHFPRQCKAAGKSRPASKSATGVTFEPLLYSLDTDALQSLTADTTCTACTMCKKSFWDVDREQYGCKARGWLVSGSSEIRLASGCAWREQRPNSGVQEESGWELMAPFATPVAAPKRKAVKVNKAPTLITTDPSVRDSDAPVRPEDASFIRAFEKVEGPKRDYFLPIFRADAFTEERQAKIPVKTGELGDPSLYVDYTGLVLKFCILAYGLDMTMTMVGEPGSGKTEGARHLAWRMQAPFTHLAFNEFTDPEEMFGQMEAKDGTTYVKPGILPSEWEQKIGVILSDEWNLGPDGVQQRYRMMNDASRRITLFDRTFTRGEYCFHLAAINPAHDFRNIGAKELASADVRRLSFHFMPVADDQTKRAIITEGVKRLYPHEKPFDGKRLEAIIKISKDLREQAAQGQLPHHWALSQDLKVALLSLHLPLVDAYKTAYLDYIDPDVAEVAISAIKSHIPMGGVD